MKKRGQLEQPFIYIFALIVIAFILFFGFNAIKKVMKLGETVSAVQFKIELEKEINHIYYLDTGSRGEVSLNVPVDFKYICFTDKGSVLDKFPEQDNLLRILAKDDKNIFLIPKTGSNVEKYSIANIKGKENPLCILSANNKFIFILENKGDHVEARTP